MKEHGDSGSTATRGLLHPSSSPHLSSPHSEKIIRDQELHHLVTSSIPSPPYHHTGLSLMNPSAALVLDPIYSSHLLASIAAANANSAAAAGGHFQLPIPIQLALNPASHQHHLQPHLHHQRNIFHLPATVPTTTYAGLPGATLPNQAQLDILSSWVAASDDKKITSTTSSTPNSVMSTGSNKNGSNNNNKTKSANSNKAKKNGNSQAVNAKNNKNIQNNNGSPIQKQKRSGAGSNNNKKNGKPSKTERRNNGTNLLQLHEGIVSSSENELPNLKDAKVVILEKEPMMTINESIIQPFIFGSPPVTPKSGKKGDSRAGSPHNNNNNNNNITNLKGQTSPGSGGQNGGPRDKVFTCPTCNRCFGYKHVLQNHERTHTGEKPFECSICMKKFTRDHHLKTHMRLHTGEKPYQCNHCDRQFVQVANLRRHLRVHTGERPYACELCSSRFSDSNQLKAHMLIHKGEKPYSCTECGGKFRRRHHLAHHKCSSSSPDTSEEMMTTLNSSMSSSSPPQLLTPSSTGGGDSRGTGCESEGKGTTGKDLPLSKRGRKCRETRRIIRLEGIPVAAQTVTTSTNGGGGAIASLLEKGTGGGATPAFQLPVAPPEQDHPEDLSMNGNGLTALRVRHYSGSSSSVTASTSSTPSPRGPALMLLSTSRPYSSSSSASFGEETPDLYASDEDLRAADSSTNGKMITENELSSMSD